MSRRGWVTIPLNKIHSALTGKDEPQIIQLKDEPEGTDDFALPRPLTLNISPVTPGSSLTAGVSFLKTSYLCYTKGRVNLHFFS